MKDGGREGNKGRMQLSNDVCEMRYWFVCITVKEELERSYVSQEEDYRVLSTPCFRETRNASPVRSLEYKGREAWRQ